MYTPWSYKHWRPSTCMTGYNCHNALESWSNSLPWSRVDVRWTFGSSFTFTSSWCAPLVSTRVVCSESRCWLLLRVSCVVRPLAYFRHGYLCLSCCPPRVYGRSGCHVLPTIITVVSEYPFLHDHESLSTFELTSFGKVCKEDGHCWHSVSERDHRTVSRATREETSG